MFTKFKTKLGNMTTQNWIVAGLWIMTFILLLTFVILAAVIDKDSGTISVHHEAVSHAEVTWADKANLTIGDTVADKHSTVVVVLDGPTGNYMVKTDAFDEVVKGSTYANIMAASGVAFVASLFGALITTVMIAHNKRKGGK